MTGEGTTIDIVVIVGGQRGLSAASGLSYARPTIIAVTLYAAADASAMDCSIIDTDGKPARGGGSALVQIDGTNFGNNVSSVEVTINGGDCLVLSSSETGALCATTMCYGASSTDEQKLDAPKLQSNRG